MKLYYRHYSDNTIDLFPISAVLTTEEAIKEAIKENKKREIQQKQYGFISLIDYIIERVRVNGTTEQESRIRI